MMTMDLERHLSLFYGVCSKMKYFYWYNDIDTLFSLCKVNNYFYKSKKIIYNTIIVYLSILQPIEGINKYSIFDEIENELKLKKIMYYLELFTKNKILKKNKHIMKKYEELLYELKQYRKYYIVPLHK